MKRYFTNNGKDQEGPFSLDDLKQKGITSKTKIWFDGIGDWTEAGQIEELKDIILKTPPPFEKGNPINQTFDKAKKVLEKDYVNEIEGKIPSKRGKTIFKGALILLAILGLISLIIFLLPTTESREKHNPDKFLSVIKQAVIERHTPNSLSVLADGNRETYCDISGKIMNSAKLTTYKDVTLEIEFFSRTNTSLGKKEVTVIEKFEPDKETWFRQKIKFDLPEEFNDWKWKIIGAEIFE
jgi:hypothetical protein